MDIYSRWPVITNVLTICLTAFIPECLSSEATPENTGEYSELLSILDEETTLATKTRLNSDFVPGMVSVLNGADMEVLGMHTVWEALSTVPGIQTTRTPEGEPLIIMRGLPFPFNAGNVRVLVNSIAMSGESSGLSSSILFMPIQQIDRIEVMRGPGSAIYGDFAFLGLINIITKQDGNQVFISGDNDANQSFGLQLSSDPASDSDLRFTTSFAGFEGGKGTIPADDKAIPKRRSAIVQIEYQNITLTGQHFQHKLQDFNRSSREERSRSLALTQQYDISDNFSLNLDLSYLLNTFVAAGRDYDGSITRGEVQLGWQPDLTHEFLLDISAEKSDIDKAVTRIRELPQNNTDVFDFSFSSRSISLQDQISLSDHFTLTPGLRYNRKTDIDDDIITPRIGGVWRIDEQHILKAQYSEGYRSPTFFELFNGNNLNPFVKFETNKTTELSYIYRAPFSTVRVTVFVSDIDNMIFPGNPGEGFRNYPQADIRGSELEWEQQFSPRLTLKSNLSYIHTTDTRSPGGSFRRSTGSSLWLSNLSAISQLSDQSVLSIHWHHVGDRSLDQAQTDGYDLVDLVYSQFNVFSDGFNLSGGVKNLFDDDLVYVQNLPTGVEQTSFPGRTFWLQADYVF